MSTPVTLVPGTLTYDCYPPPQQLNIDIITLAHAFLDQNFPGVYVGDTEPPADQRDRIWFNTSPNSGKWYWYINGMWQRPYDIVAGSGENKIIEIPVDDYNAEQGGDAVSMGVGNSAGPLWIEVTALQGRVPIGIGLIPTSDPAATVTAIGDTKDTLGNQGEYAHKLTGQEMAGHWHGVGTDGAPGGGDPPIMIKRGWGVGPYTQRLEDTPGSASWVDGTAFSAGTMGTTNPIDDPTATVTPANVMQPYLGRIFVKRTARIYVKPPF